MTVPPRADDARLKQLFPEVTEDPPPRTFELGMVLGGTVSAGAYTAGALDFLLEALEAWHADAHAPHRVVIKTAAGTSGGAVCASILGLLSSRVVPHVSKDETPHGQRLGTSEGAKPEGRAVPWLEPVVEMSAPTSTLRAVMMPANGAVIFSYPCSVTSL